MARGILQQREGIFGVGLGDVAMSPLVRQYLPDLVPDWGRMDDSMRRDVNAEASRINSEMQRQRRSFISTARAEGGCDATQPGRLAGGLRELAIERAQARGVPQSKIEAASGPEDQFSCKLWQLAHTGGPTLPDARSVVKLKHGMGLPGVRPFTLDEICGSNVKLPTCAPKVTAAPAPKPMPKIAPPTMKRLDPAKWALYGTIVGALGVGVHAYGSYRGWWV